MPNDLDHTEEIFKMMPALSVEYLIVMKAKGGFCTSVESFNNLLCADAEIKIESNTVLTYNGLTVRYSVQTNELLEKGQRYFYIKLDCDDVGRVDDFAILLKAVRSMARKTDGHFAVIWDDIAFYYATLAYPRINKIENLLRKLIAKFMYTSVGMNWGDTTLPDDLRNSLKRNKRNHQNEVNFLYETDFVQLADYLFKKYQSPTNGNELIQDKIDKANTAAELDVDELKSYIPKSNWTRYFADVVNCEDTFLDKRWRKLYRLRNLVAHNGMLTKNDYNEILQLVDEVQKPIQEAIDNLDKLVIPEDEKETIAENFATNRGPLYGEYILLWKQIETELIRIQDTISNQSQPKQFRGALSSIKELHNAQLIDSKQYNALNRAREIRNLVVHQSDANISDDMLIKGILEAEYVIDWLKNIPLPNKTLT